VICVGRFSFLTIRARENVSRLLGEWTKRKIIDRRSSLGFVIHKARLEREARFSE
jgi:hypothetical protein